MNRAEKFGVMAADALMEAAHLTYNAPRGRAMINACITRLQARVGELVSRKATPEYRKARYGKRKNHSG